jgi:hypothetical protein
MLRRLLRHRKRAGGDADGELRFWVEQWEPHIRAGALFSPNGLELIGEDEVAGTYEGRRWIGRRGGRPELPRPRGGPRGRDRGDRAGPQAGGMLILNVDVDGEPTAEEPHAFSAEDVRRIVRPLRVERERAIPEPHGHVGRQLVVVAMKDVA